MKPRAAWLVLAKKARQKCDEAQSNLIKARERVHQLQASRERMANVHADCLQRSRQAERKRHNMAETLNFRGFMQQIQNLIARVDIDLQQAIQHHQSMKAALLVAEKERIQLETLMHEDLKRVRHDHHKREQRELDAAGVMLHNLKY